jgi:hypothetical protein
MKKALELIVLQNFLHQVTIQGGRVASRHADPSGPEGPIDEKERRLRNFERLLRLRFGYAQMRSGGTKLTNSGIRLQSHPQPISPRHLHTHGKARLEPRKFFI